MPAERWSAVDGRRLDFKALEELVYGGELSAEAVQRLFLPNQQKVFGMDLTPGAIGCALSHMEIWLDIMTRHGEGEFRGDERSQFLVAPRFKKDEKVRLKSCFKSWFKHV